MFLNLSSRSGNTSEDNPLGTPPNSEINSQENLPPSKPNSNLQFSTLIPHKTRKAELLMAPMVQFLDSIFRLESDRSSTTYLTGELKHLPNILLYVIPEDVSDLIEDPDLNKPMKSQGSESCLQTLTKGTKKVKGPMSLAQIATDPAAATNIQPFPQQQGHKVLRTGSSDRTKNLQANNRHSSAKYSDFLFLYSKKKSQSESAVHQISQVPPGGKDLGHTMPNSESGLDVAGNNYVSGNTTNNKHSLQARRSTRTASDICSESMRTPNQRRVGSHSKQDSAAAHQHPVLQIQEATARSTCLWQDKQSWTADSQRSGRLLPSNSLPKPPEHSQPSWLMDPTQPNSHRRPTDLEIPMAMYSYGQYASDSFIRRPLVHPAYGIPGYSGNYWFPGYAGFYHPYMNLGTCQSPPSNIQLNVHLANSASKEAGATCPPPLLGKKEKGKVKH